MSQNTLPLSDTEKVMRCFHEAGQAYGPCPIVMLSIKTLALHTGLPNERLEVILDELFHEGKIDAWDMPAVGQSHAQMAWSLPATVLDDDEEPGGE